MFVSRLIATGVVLLVVLLAALGAARSSSGAASEARSLGKPAGPAPPHEPARPARGRAAALRLRRGDAAPAPALGDRARRAARDLPHALPRRPLPRPAGDAADVLAPGPRAAPHRPRTARARRALRRPQADLREAQLPARARGDPLRGHA